MDWYEEDVAGLEAAWDRHPPPTGAAVFYGSSSIRLWATLSSDFPDVPVVNAGFGGSTLEACAWFFNRLIPRLRPGSLIVYAGDNDIGGGQSPQQVLESLRELLRGVDSFCPGCPVLFLSIKPSPVRQHLLDCIREANELARAEIESRPGGYYIDLFSPMLSEGALRPELFSDDGLHLSPAGYHLWKDILQQHRTQWAPSG